MSELANGDARRVSTLTMRISRRSIAASTPRSAGRSKTSWRHSRYVSRMIGKLPKRDGDAEQLRRALAHLPQRRALAGAASRQQQGARRVLAEVAREQCRRAERADDELLDVLGADADRLPRPRPRHCRPCAVGCTRPAGRRHRGRRSWAGARRCRRRSRSAARRGPAARADAPRSPAPTARGRVRQTASAGRSASRPARRGSAAARSCGRSATRR